MLSGCLFSLVSEILKALVIYFGKQLTLEAFLQDRNKVTNGGLVESLILYLLNIGIKEFLESGFVLLLDIEESALSDGG
jgi:hypothetical protein